MQQPDHAEKAGSSSQGAKGDHASTSLPQPAVAAASKPKMHPAVIIGIWIALSSSVIVYNK